MPYNTLTVLPAYGRDYPSKAEVLKDWEANKDFIVARTGQTVSKSLEDLLRFDGYTHITFRYKSSREVYIKPL